jgi:hypothetical protein
MIVKRDLAETVRNPDIKAQLAESREKFALPPNAIARRYRSRSSSRPMLM